MSDIIINTTSLKAFDALSTMSQLYGKEEGYADRLWQCMLDNNELMEEFIYYLEHGMILDKMKVSGYSLTDLYVFEIENFNLLITNLGKNSNDCNKDLMVLNTFYRMSELIENPEAMIRKLNEGRGMDKL